MSDALITDIFKLMRSREYLGYFESISPSRWKEPLEENHNSSLNSNYDRLKDSVSTHQHTQQAKSSDNLYLAKMESKVLELQKKLDHQKYQMETLTSETEAFMKLCEEQKRQLESAGMEMMRQEYEEQ